jgi:CubicO group peptidase (beta-lactamase class C family)
VNLEAAAAYADRHGLEALLVQREGETLFERYAAGFNADKPHALYSGTKSFWGPVALAAEEDGLLSLDEPVGATFASWNAGLKTRVTLRQLLALTSGIGFGGLGSAVPSYEKALAVELKNEPGAVFTYGGIPLQVFGAVLAQKLGPRNLTPHEYLQSRVLDRAGVKIGSWRTLPSGTKPLPTGAFVTAAEWAKYGRFVLATPSLAACFAGSRANAKYGLGWWLASEGVSYASGSGGQAMYLIANERTVVMKFGRSSSYKHDAFLKRLLPGS